MSWVDTLHRMTLGREQKRKSFGRLLLGKVAFVIFSLVVLAVYISINGPVM